MYVRIACLADGTDPPVANPDIAFDDAPMVEKDRIRDDRVGCAVASAQLRLAHAVANDLSASELDLVSVGREIPFDLDKQLSVGKPDLVACCRAVHVRIRGALY